MKVNQIVFLQFLITHLYMRKHNLTQDQFLALDERCDLLGFLEDGYEPLHITGVDGIMDEVERYIGTIYV
jgi:hypothetical protein